MLDHLFKNNFIYGLFSGVILFLLSGLYISYYVVKEDNFQKRCFNWSNANLFALVTFLIYLIMNLNSLINIYSLEKSILMQQIS